MLTFRQFLARSVARDNPRGDLIQDLKADRQLPEITSYQQLASYLNTRLADGAARIAALRYWREYERHQRLSR